MDPLLQVGVWSGCCVKLMLICNSNPAALHIAPLRAHWHALLLPASRQGDVGMSREGPQKLCTILPLHAVSLGYPGLHALYPQLELKSQSAQVRCGYLAS